MNLLVTVPYRIIPITKAKIKINLPKPLHICLLKYYCLKVYRFLESFSLMREFHCYPKIHAIFIEIPNGKYQSNLDHIYQTLLWFVYCFDKLLILYLYYYLVQLSSIILIHLQAFLKCNVIVYDQNRITTLMPSN